MVEKLSKDTLDMEITHLKDWHVSDTGDAIEKNFRFQDFMTAFAFMTQIAMMAEKMNHHPEWKNVYSQVHVRLTTHECRGVSVRDLALAKFINAVEKR